MRKTLLSRWSIFAVIGFIAILSIGIVGLARADEQSDDAASDDQISISISPVTETFQIQSNKVYDGTMNVTNAGKIPFDFIVFSAPYSFSLSETTNDYSPNYTAENNYTQIARWVTVKDQAGNFVSAMKSDDESTLPTFTAAPGETIAIEYHINTPDNIPAGGQYAALFAQTIPPKTETSGISAAASLGMKIFGRSEEGEAIQSADITDMKISKTFETETDIEQNGQSVKQNVTIDRINGSGKVKNTGNLDFSARGVLKVTNIFGEIYYETPDNKAQVSIIPDSELPLSDAWEETPNFGLFRATWTITAGDSTESVEMVVFLVPPFVIVLAIIVLTILIIWIILMVRRRKERRSRFSV